MSDKYAGGNAFPYQFRLTDGDEFHDGMSLRDWFAGQALAGMTANPKLLTQFDGFNFDNVNAAYQLADAMLAEREKGRP